MVNNKGLKKLTINKFKKRKSYLILDTDHMTDNKIFYFKEISTSYKLSQASCEIRGVYFFKELPRRWRGGWGKFFRRSVGIIDI